MIRNEPVSHRAPVVLGRDEPLRIPDGAFRAMLIAAVVVLAGTIFALALMPAARAAGRATMRFTDQFTGLAPGDLQFPRFPERSTILARDGSVLATLYLDENRKVVRLDDVAPIARDAVIAIEDSRFYDHGALDLEGILRAAFKNLKAGEITEGGSTITQQLVKGIFTSGERTFARKLEEARLAFRIEQEYSKDQILELYLNEVYMGRSVNGIEAAAEFYFAKRAKDLNLPEAATLAGLIAAPEGFNPITEPEAALERRNHVIDRMVALDMVSEAEGEAAKAEPIALDDSMRTANAPGDAPYFVEFIRDEILRGETFAQFGPPLKAEQKCEPQEDGSGMPARCRALYHGGLRIQTTLEPRWLDYAKEAVEAQLAHPDDPQSAVVTVDSANGGIRTLLGGTEFGEQKFDIASQGLRQPGSAFKPFTLVAALEQGIPAGKIYDKGSPKIVPGCDSDGSWEVHNAEGGSAPGFINMVQATAASVNTYFAQLVKDTGAQNVVNVAKKMGISSPLDPVCSITLGSEEATPLEMASAYATLANDGIYCEPFAIGRVTGPNGEDVYRHQRDCEQVVDPKIVATVSSMLQGVVSGGTGGNAAIGRPLAGKTGTTQEHSDGWFVGYTHQQLSTAVWVGDIRGAIPIENRGSIAGPLFGGNKPALIFGSYMSRAVEGLPVTSFPAAPPLPSAEVPNVIGLTEAEAIEVLAEANFTAVVEEQAARAPAGIVAAQDPAAGASVTAGSPVTIYVSTGEVPDKGVPNVVGLTEGAAHDRLRNAGFEVRVERVNVDERDEDGIVRAQDPQGGAKVDEGSTVTIVVGRYVPPPSPSPSPTCSPSDRPRCDEESRSGSSRGSPTAAGAAIAVPLGLAAGARRRALRTGSGARARPR